MDTTGTRLKIAREKHGFSVADITAATKMRPSIILALEADDYTKFPSITHARNFLSLYGKHLHVDVSEGLSGLATPGKIGIENYQYLNVDLHENTSYKTSPRPRMRLHAPARSGDQTLRTLGIVAGGILFLLFATYLIVNLRRLNLATPDPAAPPVESTETPIILPVPTPPAIRNAPQTSATPFYPAVPKDHPLIRTPRPTPF